MLRGLDLRPATRRYNRSLTIVERERIIFFIKTAQLLAGIKMWSQLWLKRKRPLDYTHQEGKPTRYSIFKLVDGHEEGSQEGYEPDGCQNRPRVDASRRSVGGEEDPTHYKASLAAATTEQGDATRFTSRSEEGTQMDE